MEKEAEENLFCNKLFLKQYPQKVVPNSCTFSCDKSDEIKAQMDKSSLYGPVFNMAHDKASFPRQ